jgi:hypothetical protein
MDWSQVSRSQWMVGGGAVVAVISTLFLDWYSISAHIGPITVSASANAWDVNTLGKLAVLGSLVLFALAVVMFVPNTLQLPVPLPQAILVAGAFTALMAVLEFIDHHSHTAIGLWLTLISSAVAAYGAFELGGRVRVPTRTAS